MNPSNFFMSRDEYQPLPHDWPRPPHKIIAAEEMDTTDYCPPITQSPTALRRQVVGLMDSALRLFARLPLEHLAQHGLQIYHGLSSINVELLKQELAQQPADF